MKGGEKEAGGRGSWHHCAPADPRGESQGRGQESPAKSRSPWWMQNGSLGLSFLKTPIGAPWTYSRAKKLPDLSMLSLLHGPPQAAE